MTSKLKLDVLETGSGSGTIALNNQLSGMTSASMPSGSVVQVRQNHSGSVSRSGGDSESGSYTGTGNVSTSSTSWVTTGLSKTMTTAAGNRILMQCNIPDIFTTVAHDSVGFRFTLDGTEVNYITTHAGHKTQASARAMTAAGVFLSQVVSAGSHTVAIEWKVSAANAAGFHNGHVANTSESTLVLMEIKG